jgi:serine protease Do
MSVRNVAGGVLIVLLASASGWAQEAKGERSERAYLGVAVGPAEGGERGVLIQEVTSDSPAAKAGLKSGDRVVKMDDQDVQDVKKFLQAVASRKPGDKLTLRVLRAGQEQAVAVTLGERTRASEIPSPAPPDWPGFGRGQRPAFLGVQTQPLTPEWKKQFPVGTDTGVVVTEVLPNSPAAKAGLKPNDVITAVNDRAVQEPAQLREAVQQAGAGKEVTVQAVRGRENLALKAKLAEGAFGMFLTPGGERFPTLDVEGMFDSARRVRELERRVEELEKRLRDLEKKPAPPDR